MKKMVDREQRVFGLAGEAERSGNEAERLQSRHGLSSVGIWMQPESRGVISSPSNSLFLFPSTLQRTSTVGGTPASVCFEFFDLL